MKWKITEDMLYGADYNPDQWLDRPDILEEDIKFMKESNINVLSLGMFSWSTIESVEGEYNFKWLDDILDNLYNAGIRVFLSTPSGARPSWLAKKYPEVLRVSPLGLRNIYGERHNHCYSSPIYREKLSIINKKIAERYSNHPGVILWHISNEYGGDCHCNLCQEGFRNWLKDKYKTLENLNKAWWTIFWSHKFTSWDHIDSPAPNGDMTLHAKNLDWKRFVTYMTVDFMKFEIATLKEYNKDIPVTTNMMQVQDNPASDYLLDYWKFKKHIDISSWDSYPAWHLPGHQFIPDCIENIPVDDYRRASEVSLHHDLYRSIGNGHFLLMESTPTNVNWQQISKLKKPGMNILTSLQAVAHGSNSVQYFQWRSSKGSSEKFHGTVVGQNRSNKTRSYKESMEIGSILNKLQPISESTYPSEVAILFNWENRWAFENSQGPINSRKKAYLETVKKHYFTLWDKSIPMDLISGDEPIGNYKMLIAPMLHMISEKSANYLKEFVKNGGVLITTYQSGYVNETDLCYEGGAPGPLRELLGINIEEIDVLHEFENINIKYKDSIYNVSDYYEIIHLEGAQTLGCYIGGIADGKPGITQNIYGSGRSIHLGGRLDVKDLTNFYSELVKDLNIGSNKEHFLSSTGKLNIQKRVLDSKEYIFVMNFTDSDEKFITSEEFYDVLNNNLGNKNWDIPKYGIKILCK